MSDGRTREGRELGRDGISSWVRATIHPDDIAARTRARLDAYLVALGLVDDPHRARLVDETLASLSDTTSSGPSAIADAVSALRARTDAWVRLATESEARLDPRRLRAMLAARPGAFLVEPVDAETRRMLRARSDAFDGPARMTRQDLAPVRVPMWLVFGAVPFVATVGTTLAFARSLGASPSAPLTLALVLLFAALFGPCALAAFLASLGVVRRARLPALGSGARATELPRTVIAMPVHQEDPAEVFASVAAMREALAEHPEGSSFDLFVLSDTRDPELAAEEERCARRVGHVHPEVVPLYYRRRERNTRQKSGNVEEFLERFGHRYRYAILLDADSLVSASTLVELVRRMEANPALGLLQLPIEIVRATTLFGRAQQFAASLYGPLFASGLSTWVGADGNYYGHNAILRIDAFVACCGLPALDGEPPFGGHILSHDFVEAALLRRAGWEVRLADDLGESYEECPPTFGDYAKRDRRWCQGNLQHVRVLFARGLAPMSRVHLWLGAFAYLASPLLLAFVALFAVHSGRVPGPPGDGKPLAFLGAMLALLVYPKLLAWVTAALSPRRRVAFGGLGRLALGVAVELVFSFLLAPRMMLAHTRMVFEVFIGRAVGWTPQRRSAPRTRLGEGFREHGVATLVGVLVALVSLQRGSGVAMTTALLWGPLVLAIPFDLVSGSRSLGASLERWRVLGVPSETEPSAILRRRERLRGLSAPDSASRFRDLVLDPVLNATHVARVRGHGRIVESVAPELLARAATLGPGALSAAERVRILGDADALEALHHEAWLSWPVESWQLGRARALLPVEGDSVVPSASTESSRG